MSGRQRARRYLELQSGKNREYFAVESGFCGAEAAFLRQLGVVRAADKLKCLACASSRLQNGSLARDKGGTASELRVLDARKYVRRLHRCRCSTQASSQRQPSAFGLSCTPAYLGGV